MRDHWLWQIQLKLRERGVWEEIRSVAHLRELYPNLPRPLNNAALERLSIEVEMANLEDWATVPPKKPDRVQLIFNRLIDMAGVVATTRKFGQQKPLAGDKLARGFCCVFNQPSVFPWSFRRSIIAMGFPPVLQCSESNVQCQRRFFPEALLAFRCIPDSRLTQLATRSAWQCPTNI